MTENRRRHGAVLALAWVLSAGSLGAQTPERTCAVSILNQTAFLQDDDTWIVPNVPSNMGPVRARVTCVEDGQTTSGASDFFTVKPGRMNAIPKLVLGQAEPAPATIEAVAPLTLLTTVGQAVALTVTARFADGTTVDVTTAPGTTYRSTRPASASVDENGVVTAGSSGRALITVLYEAVVDTVVLDVLVAGDSDGDGLPDDFEVAAGLDPNNAADALDDPDGDGLTNLGEFQAGLDLFDPDTDGDGLRDGEESRDLGTDPLLFDTDGDLVSDGLEIVAGSNPLDPSSANLAPILESFTVEPGSLVLVFNTVIGEASHKLRVPVRLVDGTELDAAASRYGTTYTSSDLTVASFGAEAGRVFAGADGTAVVTVTNGTFSGTVPVSVESFSPTALSFLPLPGFANGVAVDGDYAYVVAGIRGLFVVDVRDPSAPFVAGSVRTLGNANDVRIEGGFAYVADGVRGLQVVDVRDPTRPQVAAAVDTPGNATDLAVAAGRAYVADGSAGLQVVDVTDPFVPVWLGSLDTPGNARGVDVSGELVVVADDQAGVHVVDVSDPAAPFIAGSTHTRPNAESRAADVVVRERRAWVADGSSRSLGGLRLVDFREPKTPVVVGSTDNGFGLVGVALEGGLALAADFFFVNAVPIFDVTTAEPIFSAALDFSGAPSFRDDNGNGIAVRDGLVFLAGAREIIADNGAFGDSGLHVGRYLRLQDNEGVAPTVALAAPAGGDAFRERTQVTVRAEASDDVQVAAVEFSIDGEGVHRDFGAPFEHVFRMPVGVAELTLGARAVDLGGNEGFAEEVTVRALPNEVPTVELLSPLAGSRFAEGVTIPIAAQATDDGALAEVEFRVDGVSQATVTVAPYRFDFTIPLVGPGQVTVTAVAVDDTGQTASTEPLVIGVDDDLPPSAAVISPVDGAEVVEGSMIFVLAGATDDAGVVKVRFFVDGALVFEDFDEPYEVGLEVPPGASELAVTVTAVDTVGQVGSSTATLRVAADPGTTLEGFVALGDGTPVAGATVSAFEASATTFADGSFRLGSVPTVRGDVTVTAIFETASGVTLEGRSEPVAPLPGGVIDVGVITIAEFRGVGMVADDATDSLTVFNAETDTVLGSVRIGSGLAIGDCSVKADLTLGFATNFGRRVWVIDLTASPPSLASGANPIPISNDGEDTSMSPDERFLVVCDGGQVQPVSVVDVAARVEVSTFDLGTDCSSVDVCADGSVLVTSFLEGTVRRLILDGSGNLADTGEVLTVPDPNNVTCSPGGDSGIVVTRGGDEVRSFTVPGLAVTDVRSLSGSFGISGAFHPSGDRVYVRDNGGAVDVFAFDSVTAALGAAPLLTIPIVDTTTFFGVDQMALEPGGAKLYVSQPARLNVYDAATGALLTQIAAPSLSTPTGVCFPRAP